MNKNPTRKLATMTATAALTLGALVATTPAAEATSEAAEKVYAQAHYETDLGPSLAWQLASKADRKRAERQYLATVGSWNNGCKADLKHAYQGVVTRPWFVQPYLPVELWDDAPNTKAVLFAAYVDGVCN